MTILYKYYPPDTAKIVLSNSSVRFSPLFEFNDPFEGNIHPVNYFSIEDFGYEMYQQIIEVLENNEDLYIHKQSGLIPQLISLYKKGGVPDVSIHDFALDLSLLLRGKKLQETPSDWSQTVHQRLTKYIGALCLTETFDNLLMWSHYAKNHKGIVIGFDIDKFPKQPIEAQPIIYAENYPTSDIVETTSEFIGRNTIKIDNPLDDTFIRCNYFTKSVAWSYEKEWRILASAKINEENHVLQLSGDSFHSLYIGCKASPEDKAFFIEKAKTLKSDIKIFNSCISTKSFSLEFSELDIA